jgi:Rps23 Pro-64 3,4-dihydroxylase Tpa1-like proline 4-hydroxylase
MTTPEELRRQKVAEAIIRRGFVQAAIPAVRDTLVDFRQISELSKQRTDEYKAGEPFPHIVIDDFLPQDSLRAVHEALPALDDPSIVWGNLNANMANGRPAQLDKYHLQNVLFMKPAMRQLIAELNSGPFTVQLERLTGIPRLLSDPLLQGGGVHLVKPGGLLRVHADFNRHPAFHIERRLNLLLYMNADWKEEYGGHLELWDRDVKTCVKKVPPILNRCVIFNTESTSFHGHPHPLACPEGRLRQSIALYYYTVDRADKDETPSHGTLWQELPDERDGPY